MLNYITKALEIRSLDNLFRDEYILSLKIIHIIIKTFISLIKFIFGKTTMLTTYNGVYILINNIVNFRDNMIRFQINYIEIVSPYTN